MATQGAEGPEEPDIVIDLRDEMTLDVLPVGVLFARSDGGVFGCNATWTRLSGLERSASGGHGWLETIQPEDRDHVLALVRAAAEEGAFTTIELHLACGDEPWTRWWISRTLAPRPAVVMAVADAEVEHRDKEALRHEAHHDALTGLVQRNQFFQLLAHTLAGQARHPSPVAVLYVDLDGFKEVNDRYGHAAGDQLLAAIGDVMRAAVRPEDVVARVGGDEFAVLCEHLEQPVDAARIVERIHRALDRPFEVGARAIRLSASIGVALARPGDAPEQLVDRADRAMYELKRPGRSSRTRR